MKVAGIFDIPGYLNTMDIEKAFDSKVQNNFLDTVKSMQQVLCFWNRRMLSLE